MGIFKGIRTKNGAFVTYDDTPLALRLDLKEHSPMGFEWGYNGSGPRQLALAILTKLTSDEISLNYHEEFSKDFIEPIDTKEWGIDDSLIIEWIQNNDMILKVPRLTPRFEITRVNDNEFLTYLDNNVLGKDFGMSDCNTILENNVLTTYCKFSEINQLHTKELPEYMKFEFINPVGMATDSESDLTENFTLYNMSNIEGVLAINFWFWLDINDYNGFKNSKIIVNDFFDDLNMMFGNIHIEYNKIEDGAHISEFTITILDKKNNLQIIIINIINKMVEIYDSIFNIESNSFEAFFNLPSEYKGVLKPYMQYFEEFLNDLCIKADVDIITDGEDTILAVKPKNKDEALEKIADALKIYLSAPILANQVSLDEKLNMQLAFSKLYAECSHLDSQLTLKTITLNEQHKEVELQTEIINETKRILVEVGVKEDIMTGNNTMLLNSLKSITMNNKEMKRTTFINSIKASIKIPLVFEAKFEVGKDKYD